MNNTNISKLAIEIFEKAVNDYHVHDDISRLPVNPYEKKSFEHLLYEKNWIDTVQWHYEDIIRDPEIDPIEGMKLKRMIDSSNQNRTEMVEYIDSYFLNLYSDVDPIKEADLLILKDLFVGQVRHLALFGSFLYDHHSRLSFLPLHPCDRFLILVLKACPLPMLDFLNLP